MALIQGRARPRGRGGDLIVVAIPALAGALICAIGLGSRSLWLDEGASFAIASQHGAALWHGIAHDGGNMLVYYLLLHVVIAVLGDAPWLLRLPALLATAATGALVAALALRLFDHRRLALSAGLIAVVSLPLVFWGQNARGYAPLVTFTVASFLALVAILQTPLRYEPSRWALAGYVGSLVIAFYLGYDVALVIPAQLALLLIFRERARVVIGCLVLVAVLCIPLAVLAVERGSGQLFWVTPLSFRIVGQAARTLVSAGLPPNFHATATTLATEIVMAVVSVVGVMGAGLAALRAAKPAPIGRAGSVHLGSVARRVPRRSRAVFGESWALWLALGWLVIGAALSVGLLALGEPVELPRVTILLMPPLALLIAWALCQPLVPPALGTLTIVAVLALRLLQVTPAYGTSPEPWSAATAYVTAHSSAAAPACVVFYPQDGRNSFDYYLLRAHQGGGDPAPALTPVLPSTAWARVRPFVEDYASLDAGQLAGIQTRCPRLWLIASHEGQRDGTPASRANLARYLALQRALARVYAHDALRSFGWSAPVKVRLFTR